MSFTSTLQHSVVGALAIILGTSLTPAPGQQEKGAVLRIGATSNVAPGTKGTSREKVAMESLRNFIKAETGFTNQVLHENDWRDLADKMGKGEYSLGVYPGFEFAWAMERNSKLKPLSLAVNTYVYSTARIVVRKDSKITDFASLEGQAISMCPSDPTFVRFYVEREAQARGKKVEKYFSRIAQPQFVEDALEDVIEGELQAAAVDRAGLEAFKRRKPGRFNQLKEIVRSQPFPPTVLAYQDKALDDNTLQRFRTGLTAAARKEKGEMLLTLFRLTAFEAVPDDFTKVLTETRKCYPADTIEDQKLNPKPSSSP
ncbi:MAG: phosphate/phosphite/phosphonate ABC transporter substrate-binding protein [Gemmataceae bacterium]|nr:phosphate/phosphite/phosphonate ABC transporter substrate-binding protein [Gemmataceae bacterium]